MIYMETGDSGQHAALSNPSPAGGASLPHNMWLGSGSNKVKHQSASTNLGNVQMVSTNEISP